MMKTRIGLAVLALSLSACTATVAQRDGDVSGQALPRAPRALAGWELSDCDAKSRVFRTRSDITFGGTDTSIAAMERDIQSRLYWRCLEERRHQAP